MIKLIIFDIDGVLTDGSIIVNETGSEQKKINLKDIDAIFELKSRGFILAAITGEKTPIVSYFEKRFPWDFFYSGQKNKIEAIKEIENKCKLHIKEICYVGDGKYDKKPLQYIGLAICPQDAIDSVKDVSDIILQNKCGEGCIWELISILDCYNTEYSPNNYFFKKLYEHTDTFKTMGSDVNLISDVMKIAEEIINVIKNDGQIFLCGNGGSAADAQHIATEFVSKFFKDRRALNAEALTTNTSVLTALGNDYCFETIFLRQLEAKAKTGDILIGITTSGKSKNVIEAIKYSKSRGIKTVVLMGNHDNCEIEDVADYVIKVPSKITPRIQEAQMFIGHILAEYVEDKIFNNR